jgi:diketogulonate reductase-like aldo/keto reductase
VTEAYGPLTPVLRHPTGGPLAPVLSRIAQRLHKDTGKPVDNASVLLLWTKATGVVAVTASGNPENIKKIALVQSLPDLTAEEVTEITETGKKIHFRYYVRASRSISVILAIFDPGCRTSTWRTTSRSQATSRLSELVMGERYVQRGVRCR